MLSRRKRPVISSGISRWTSIPGALCGNGSLVSCSSVRGALDPCWISNISLDQRKGHVSMGAMMVFLPTSEFLITRGWPPLPMGQDAVNHWELNMALSHPHSCSHFFKEHRPPEIWCVSKDTGTPLFSLILLWTRQETGVGSPTYRRRQS